jgi:hypothetical protein
MLKKLTILLFILLTAGCSSEGPRLEDAVSTKYQVGDKWNYFTRPGEELSSFIVTKIDKITIAGEPQNLIHIYVDRISIDHPQGGTITNIPHMPFTEAALDRSAIQPYNTVLPLPEGAESGYQSWREAYESGDASFFDVSIAHALENLEATIVQSNPD